MAVDYQLIGARIAKKRKMAGKTQEKLAEELGVSVGYVSQLERGITKINLDMLSRISEAVGEDMAWFVAKSSPAARDYARDELNELILKLSPENRRFVLKLCSLLTESKYD